MSADTDLTVELERLTVERDQARDAVAELGDLLGAARAGNVALDRRITALVEEVQEWADLANTAGESIEVFLDAVDDDPEALAAAVLGLRAWVSDWREQLGVDEPDPPMCPCGEPATVELAGDAGWLCEGCAA